jgi:hypothetical protein
MSQNVLALDGKSPGSAEAVSMPASGSSKRRRTAKTSSPSVKLLLTYIEWEDHHSNDVWQSAEDLDVTPRVIHTVGWAIKEDERIVILATTVDPLSIQPYANTMTILKATIRKRRVLRYKPISVA